MTKVNSGQDAQWRSMVGAPGAKGTATGSGASSLTDSGASWGTTQFVGALVVAGSAYAIVLSHTTTVLTVDRWYDAASPGGTAATTPTTTALYCIIPGGPPCPYMALTADAGAVVATDTALPSEITTAGGGLIRKLATQAHTAAASSGTLTGAFTGNGSDSYPVTIAKIGTFPSLTSGKLMFETLVSPTATLSASGDVVTVTDTISQ